MKRLLAAAIASTSVIAGSATAALQDVCGPFTDVSPAFCPYVLEMYYLGITAGTSPTTYSPDKPVTRGQAAVFVSKGVNQAIARSSKRASLGNWWTPRDPAGFPRYSAGAFGVVSDGTDVWAVSMSVVVRTRASDGKWLGTWTGISGGAAIVSAMGRIFVSTNSNPAKIYMIDPSLPPGPATEVVGDLGQQALGLTFDGSRLWTANAGHSVSIVTPAATLPWPSVTVLMDGPHYPLAAIFDGRDVWIADNLGKLLRMNSDGTIAQTVEISSGSGVFQPTFDGENIWVPLVAEESELVVVRAASGEIIRRLTGNGLTAPHAAAFDGQRVLVTNSTGGSDGTLSLWRAADLAPLGFVDLFAAPNQVCSDGVSFWYTEASSSQLVRF